MGLRVDRTHVLFVSQEISVLQEKLLRKKSDCLEALYESCQLFSIDGAGQEGEARNLRGREMTREDSTVSRGTGCDDFNREDSLLVRSRLLEPTDLDRDLSLERSLLLVEILISWKDLDPFSCFGSCDLLEVLASTKTTKKIAKENTANEKLPKNIANNETKNKKNNTKKNTERKN